ncbi:COR domain-containing protein [Micromonospora sp. NPDC048898]|uniref:COR domain-containing protein n=1 Tax=Micromonospora sp. NPDC048898 TaxID=3364260 RepID=UPI00371F7651
MDDGTIVEAQHRIAAAADGHVDLSGLDLTAGDLAELLRDTPALADVTSLDLAGNNLDTLPDAVAAWTSLTSLDLGENRLTGLPDAVAAWTSLTDLDLSANQLTALPDAVAAWTSLTQLHLNANQLTALPDAVAAWTSLTQLRLAGNQLTALPDAVAAWTGLTTLYAYENQLSALPDAVAAWTALTRLNVDRNQLSALPDAVAAWTALTRLDMDYNQLTALPDAVAAWAHLNVLYLDGNQFTTLPDAVAAWTSLTELHLDGNQLTTLPDAVAAWTALLSLSMVGNQLTTLPDAVAAWTSLTELHLDGNQLNTLPDAIGQFEELQILVVQDNPLPPEVLAAEVEGTEALLAFLRDVATDGISISEAKLLFVGAGEAGKSTLLGALRGEPWQDRHQTQGMEIKPLVVRHAGHEITLNGWDFGGQQAYQPAHQLFFSAPAVYVVVWKPRPGVAAGMVESWIAMIAHRAPDARVLVVASHGGPSSRADAIDEAHLKQRFGSLIVGFHEVDSAVPDGRLEVLREAIAVTAGTLPHVRRTYPATWQRTIEAVTAGGRQVIDYRGYEAVAAAQGLNTFQARTLASNAHHLGKWIYYADDDALAAFVILQPDWLNVAIAAVLDSRDAVDALGLVAHRMLGSVWSAAQAPDGTRYTREQQRLFLALMGRFELTYQVSLDAAPEPVSLIAQLVPAAQPDLRSAWVEFRTGDREYLEVCRVSEGPAGPVVIPDSLMYRLIVRLHHQRYTEPDSLQGVHWQQGLVLQSRYGARALLTVRTGVGVQVQVRGPDAVTYLRQVTDEIRYCIERFWPGLSTVALVACRDGCGLPTPGAGLFDVDKLIKLRDAHGQSIAQCPISGCDAFPAINSLLGGSGASQEALASLRDGVALMDSQVRGLSRRVTELNDTVRANLAGVNAQLTALMWQLNDEAADGPRLFTLTPVEASLRNPQWTTRRMRLTLYCEHSLQPVHVLEPDRRDAGVYYPDVPREWWTRAVPLLKATTVLLKPLLGVGLAELKLDFSEEQWKAIEEQVALANETLNAAAEAANHLTTDDHSAGLAERAPHAPASPVYAEGAVLRTLHVVLRSQDVTLADLRKVVRPDGRILWVHRRFEHLYHSGLPVIP